MLELFTFQKSQGSTLLCNVSRMVGIAYVSDDSGRKEVYVRELSFGPDGKPQATAKHPISTGEGVDPHRRDDGRALIYFSIDLRTVRSATIVTKSTFQSMPAKVLFQFQTGPSVMLRRALLLTCADKRLMSLHWRRRETALSQSRADRTRREGGKGDGGALPFATA
jgi:hypothetical protein